MEKPLPDILEGAAFHIEKFYFFKMKEWIFLYLLKKSLKCGNIKLQESNFIF